MFTGIIEELGVVNTIIRGSKSMMLSIACKKIIDDVNIGESIAVDGVCLTVTKKEGSCFFVDVMPETMGATGINKLKVAGKVNIERALKLSDRLGGHIVSGHIDGTGKIIERRKEENALWITIEASSEILKYIITKGSVAIDGISLTVAEVNTQFFNVSLIPHTKMITTLGFKKVGDTVNIECDLIGKYVEKILNQDSVTVNNKKRNTLELLKENGFM